MNVLIWVRSRPAAISMRTSARLLDGVLLLAVRVLRFLRTSTLRMGSTRPFSTSGGEVALFPIKEGIALLNDPSTRVKTTTADQQFGWEIISRVENGDKVVTLSPVSPAACCTGIWPPASARGDNYCAADFVYRNEGKWGGSVVVRKWASGTHRDYTEVIMRVVQRDGKSPRTTQKAPLMESR